MSQQGPGGYGGPPPGGYGGYGSPGPGGYGGPPGAAPPGAPPGWGQPPPGYPQQPAPVPPGPGPVPPKKGNVTLLLGLGCAGLLFLGGIGAASVYFFVVKPAQEVQKALTAAGGLASGATISVSDGGIVVQGPNGVSANVTDAGIVVQTPNGQAVPLGALGLAAGGAVCEQAATCCKNISEKTGNDPAALAVCNTFKSMPAVGCQQALAAYRRAAAGVGAACP